MKVFDLVSQITIQQNTNVFNFHINLLKYYSILILYINSKTINFTQRILTYLYISPSFLVVKHFFTRIYSRRKLKKKKFRLNYSNIYIIQSINLKLS